MSIYKKVSTKRAGTWYSLKKVERKQRNVREARTDIVYAARAFARVSAVCIFRSDIFHKLQRSWK